MPRALFILFFLLNSIAVSAQDGQFEDQTWDFGDVPFWRNDTAWFKVRNGTHRNLIFLPTYYNENFTILFSNRAAEPGETIRIGIVYYTQRKGKFDVEVPLYINVKPDPIHFRLKGNIKGFDPAAQLRCPAVNEGPSPKQLEKVVTIEVRDRLTEVQLLPETIIVRSKEGKKINLERSAMEYEMSVMPGGYKISVTKKGYDDYIAYINLEPYQNTFIVYLDQSTPDPEPVRPEPVIVKNTDTVFETERRKSRDDVSTSDTLEDKYVFDDKEKHSHSDTASEKVTDVVPGLTIQEYKLNNVILIVDVSSSMNRGGKLDLVKSSFNTLVNALREEDKVGVITMASEAVIIQNPTGVTERDSLKSRVDNMKASGGTNAGSAMELAYKLASENFIDGGNNQIIIATDGVFYGGSLSRQQMEKLISNSSVKGIHLSTVGIGSDPKAMQFLQTLSATGGGSFVQISESTNESTGLLEMIKNQSRRNAEN